ncbi:hypothetical protein [Streptomyces sp. NPDC050856]
MLDAAARRRQAGGKGGQRKVAQDDGTAYAGLHLAGGDQRLAQVRVLCA